MDKKISIIIPVYNEEGALPTLYKKLKEVLTTIKSPYEIIFIDDGSKDASFSVLQHIAQSDSLTKIIHFKKNFGQTAALQAGIIYGQGDYYIFMDADLQNDPTDIPLLLEKLDEGYDVVSGWRKNRKDQKILRIIPSRCANWLISYISGVSLHDYGCTLKGYKKSILKNINLFGQMHRFIPAYAALEGAKITEVVVNHHPRTTGKSKYGISRTFRVILDLLVVKFLLTYAERPMHFFGGTGLWILFLAFVSGAVAIAFKLTNYASFIETPLPTLTALFIILGILFILMGIIAEMLVRIGHGNSVSEKHKQKIKTLTNITE